MEYTGAKKWEKEGGSNKKAEKKGGIYRD